MCSRFPRELSRMFHVDCVQNLANYVADVTPIEFRLQTSVEITSHCDALDCMALRNAAGRSTNAMNCMLLVKDARGEESQDLRPS